MNLRIHSDEANLRPTPSTSLAPLARLPAGHLVVALDEPQGNWRRCRTTIDGHVLDGFISVSLLRAEINPMVDRLIEVVGEEFKSFQFGDRHETHPRSKERIRAFWLSFQDTAEPVSVAWSAAFVSFCMKNANLDLSFKFAGRHTTYLSDSKAAKLASDASRAYWAVRLSERKIKVGDLVAASRTGMGCGTAVRTYDDLPGDFCSHCDVVVAVRDGKSLAIGGNVGNTVKSKTIPLTAAGRVETGARRFAVMARNY